MFFLEISYFQKCFCNTCFVTCLRNFWNVWWSGTKGILSDNDGDICVQVDLDHWIGWELNFQLHHNSEENGPELETEQTCWEGDFMVREDLLEHLWFPNVRRPQTFFFPFPFSDSKLTQPLPQYTVHRTLDMVDMDMDPPHPVNWSLTHSTGPQTPFL